MKRLTNQTEFFFLFIVLRVHKVHVVRYVCFVTREIGSYGLLLRLWGDSPAVLCCVTTGFLPTCRCLGVLGKLSEARGIKLANSSSSSSITTNFSTYVCISGLQLK